MENSADHVGMFYCLFCGFCTADHAFVYSGSADEHTWGRFFADRMSCSAADFRQFSDQLYTSGDGQRHTVCNSDIQQTGAFKYSAAYIDECTDRALRHDMDAACCGNHYASDIFRYVFAYTERIKTAGTKERGEFRV